MKDTLVNLRPSSTLGAGVRPPTDDTEDQAAAAPETLADREQLLRTFKAQSQLLHRLQSAGLLDGEGTSLVTPVDEAIVYLEGVLEGGLI